jgi:hypothetical protein
MHACVRASHATVTSTTGSSPSPASPPLARARRNGTLTRIPTMRRPRPRCRCLSLIRLHFIISFLIRNRSINITPSPTLLLSHSPLSSMRIAQCCAACNAIPSNTSIPLPCLPLRFSFPPSPLHLPLLSPPTRYFPPTIKPCRDAPATRRWEQFQEISHAYSVLSDEDKRKKYDLYGEDSEIGANDAEDCERSPVDPKPETRNPKPETLNDAEDRERNPFAESAPLPLPALNWNCVRCTVARALGSLSGSMSLNGIQSYTRIRQFTCLASSPSPCSLSWCT